MNYEITKLDNRHSWHHEFRYMIEFKKSISYSTRNDTGVLEFDRSRRWFNEKFGWSQDVETRSKISQLSVSNPDVAVEDYNKNWAYSIKYNDYRIYIHDDATLNWFVLCHPKDQAETT